MGFKRKEHLDTKKPLTSAELKVLTLGVGTARVRNILVDENGDVSTEMAWVAWKKQQDRTKIEPSEQSERGRA